MKNIHPKEAFELLNNNKEAVIIDVRTKDEWNEGIVDCENLKLITITADFGEFERNLEENITKKNSDIMFICRSGRRSETAALIADKMGYKNNYNVVGGFIEWNNNNLPSKNLKLGDK